MPLALFVAICMALSPLLSPADLPGSIREPHGFVGGCLLLHSVLVVAEAGALAWRWPGGGGSLLLILALRGLPKLRNEHRVIRTELLGEHVELLLGPDELVLQVNNGGCGCNADEVRELLHKVVDVDALLAVIAHLVYEGQNALLIDDHVGGREPSQELGVAAHRGLQVLGLDAPKVVLLVLVHLVQEFAQVGRHLFPLLLHALQLAPLELLLRRYERLADNACNQADHRVGCDHDVEDKASIHDRGGQMLCERCSDLVPVAECHDHQEGLHGSGNRTKPLLDLLLFVAPLRRLVADSLREHNGAGIVEDEHQQTDQKHYLQCLVERLHNEGQVVEHSEEADDSENPHEPQDAEEPHDGELVHGTVGPSHCQGDDPEV
mmetsp:Transcript_54703/g.123097  ORF Transcript_54703/g.123097 Transcript_54703/m.123097 type:complete len:378 (+) Transcript_54703:21-1154(+)